MQISIRMLYSLTGLKWVMVAMILFLNKWIILRAIFRLYYDDIVRSLLVMALWRHLLFCPEFVNKHTTDHKKRVLYGYFLLWDQKKLWYSNSHIDLNWIYSFLAGLEYQMYVHTCKYIKVYNYLLLKISILIKTFVVKLLNLKNCILFLEIFDKISHPFF